MRAIQSQAMARNPTLVNFGALSTPYSFTIHRPCYSKMNTSFRALKTMA